MLTPKQAELLRYLQAQDPANMPTHREIAAALGEASNSTHRKLHVLKDRGFITLTPGKSRSIRVIKTADNIPVFEKEAS